MKRRRPDEEREMEFKEAVMKFIGKLGHTEVFQISQLMEFFTSQPTAFSQVILHILHI